jgi:HSP20 family molecular chaperone IbpA
VNADLKLMIKLALNLDTVSSRLVIPLPVRIQNTNVTADYKDGILNLTLPKSEEEKNKVVKVNLLGEK